MTLALALSGGGAAGLGHIPVLEAIDEMGIRPVALAGTSMGALIGAAYAAGMSGREIRQHVLDLAARPLTSVTRFIIDRPSILPELTGAMPSSRAVEFVWPDGLTERIEDMATPLTVVATDYYARKAMYFREGPLAEALAATIAIPGVFRATHVGGRVYLDGGVTNNLPLDALPEAEVTLAVDVASEPAVDSTELPGPMAAAAGSMRIMMHALLRQQVAARPGAIVIEPASRTYGALDFHKAEEILQAADHAREDTKRAIERALG